MSTVTIGSNKKYAEGWDAVFSNRKSAKKKAAPAKGKKKAPTPKKKQASTKKKARSEQAGRKPARRKS